MKNLTQCTVLLVAALLAAFAPIGLPSGFGQGASQTGRTMTDFATTLSAPGFDSSLGRLVAADLSVRAELDSQVLEITNNSQTAADFTVTTNVQFCGDLADLPIGFVACTGSTSTSGIEFATEILSESFVNLAPGATAASLAPAISSDRASLRVLDENELKRFVDASSVDYSVATLAGFEALGGGGNSVVEIETFANVALQVDYIYAGVVIDKLTNGGDGVLVREGDPIVWTYDVRNTGNTALQNLVITDDREGPICTVDLLDAGMTTQCQAHGQAGPVDYSNVATVVAEPIVNPRLTVADDDPSGYTVATPTPTPAPTPTAPPPTLTPTSPDPIPGSEPLIDIELATNGVDADLPPGVALTPGDPVTWTYLVTNTGPVDLYDIVVNDDLAGGICRAGLLPVGQQLTCTLEGSAVLGRHRRVGDVLGESALGQRVADVDPTHHVGADEVLGRVTTPVPQAGPGSPIGAPGEPDEVLALTGTESGMGIRVGASLFLTGAGMIALSCASRRRRRL